jgi:hypothetical protein
LKKFLFLVTAAILNGVLGCQTNFEMGPSNDHTSLIWFNLVQLFQRRRFKCESLQCTTDGWMPSDGKSSQKQYEGVSDCCLMPTRQFFSYIMVRTN